MAEFDIVMPSESRGITLGALNEVPELYEQRQVEARTAAIQQQIGELEAQIEVLTAQLSQVSQDGNNGRESALPAEEAQKIHEYKTRRDELIKRRIFGYLGLCGLSDGEVVFGEWAYYHDFDMAGGYNEVHRVYLAREAEVYIIGDTEVGKTDHYAVHRSLENPVVLSSSSGIVRLGNYSLESARPTDWSLIDGTVCNAAIAIWQKSILKTVLATMGEVEPTPLTYSDGRINQHRLTKKKIYNQSGNVSIEFETTYSRERDPRMLTEVLAFDFLRIRKIVDGEVFGQYVIANPAHEGCDRYLDDFKRFEETVSLIQDVLRVIE